MIRKLLHSIAVQPFESNICTKESIPFDWISNASPCFPVIASNIQIITKPDQFYKFLLHSCQEAKQRVTLASLYLGVGPLEENIIQTLKDNPSFRTNKLKINILLDYARGSRSEINSRTMLLPLLETNESTCHISLYHTPSLRGFYKKYISSPWNELMGLQHMKVYIFDDISIISGANLSNDYFTNRQDRYFIIKDKNLSDFYCGLIKHVQSFSFKMDKHNQLTLDDDWNLHPYEGNQNEFIEKAKSTMENFMMEMMMKYPSTQGSDTRIFPLIQMGQIGIEHDTIITNRILVEASKEINLKFATGYFNLTNQYMETLINKTEAQCDILMAHPKANGFLGARGPAGGIPFAYSLLAYKFKQKVLSSGQDSKIKLFEYLKENWTYHAKGVWYFSQNSQDPYLTLVGSPNFGERSAKKDLETQIAIVTQNEQLKRDLYEEWSSLYKCSVPADIDRPVPKWIYIFTFLFQNYF